MKLNEILVTLAKSGIKVSLQEGQLKIKAAKGALTPELKQLLVENKADILQLLEQKSKREVLHQTPIVKVPRDKAQPLSYAQQRLWFLTQLEGASEVYNIPNALKLTGQLNRQALSFSLGEIVRRHDVMRSYFTTVEGVAQQHIRPFLAFELPLVDISHSDDVEQALADLIAQGASEHFQLSTGPLYRMSLVRLAEDEHVLLINLHHIISDGWSMSVIERELTECYRAYLDGRSSPLPELEYQYGDHAKWQRQWLQGDYLKQQLAYWEGKLAGLPPLLPLPTDRARQPLQSYHGDKLYFTVGADLVTRLNEISRSHGATVFMTLLSAFKLLLSRYSAQDDIAVGTPVANRVRAEFEPMIGFFVNTVVLRSTVDHQGNFSELLNHVKDNCLEAFSHQDIPFEKLVDSLDVARNLSHSPLFQVMFMLQNVGDGQLQLPGLELSSISKDGAVSKFDLTLSLSEHNGQMKGFFEYSTALFDNETIERMSEQWLMLLEQIVQHPDEPLYNLSWLNAKQIRQLLYQFNDTQRTFKPDCGVFALFEHQATQNPDAIALSCGELSLSYSQLNRRSNQLAHYLQDANVSSNRLVGVYLTRRVEMVIALLAVMKAGGAYVPLDPNFPTQRLAHMVKDSGLDLLLTEDALLEPLVEIGEFESSKVLALDTQWSTKIHPLSETNLALQLDAQRLAYVIYTSGSTGLPKGVAVSHRALSHFMLAMNERIALEPSCCWLAVTTVAFDIAALELFGPLIVGGHLVLSSNDDVTDANALMTLITQHQVNVMQGTPATWQLLLANGWQGKQDEHQVPLRALCGGEAISANLVEQLLPRVEHLYNCYGPTEATIWSMVKTIDASQSAQAQVSVGHGLANMNHYVLDSHLSIVPMGVAGELHIGGATLAEGYFNQPSLTAERFIEHQLDGMAVQRLYKTGDLVRWRTDGTLEFLGRIDNQVKIRGFRIELGDIETQLRRCPGVKDVAVIAWKNAKGNDQLVAYLVSEGDHHHDLVESEFDGGVFKRWLQPLLPEYMIPAFYVPLPQFPLTPNGKVDRKALPAPDISVQLERSYVAPRNEVEQLLVEVWQELLDVERVGIFDNFFAIGGDSIISIVMVAKVNSEGLNMTPKMLFEHQNIAQLAEVLGAQQVSGKTLAEQGPVTGDVPLSLLQQYLCDLGATDATKLHTLKVADNSTLCQTQLEEVVSTLLGHHDMLRAQFTCVQGRWQQQLVERQSLPLLYVDYRHEKDSEALLVQAQQQTQALINHQEGWLLGLSLVEFSCGNQYIVVALHQLVADDASWEILLQDLAALCLAQNESLSDILGPKTVAYKHWAKNHSGDKTQRQDGAAQARMAHANLVAHGPHEFCQLTLDHLQYQQLTQALQAYNTTIDDMLICAFSLAFERWQPQDNMALWLTTDYRQKSTDFERTIGNFAGAVELTLNDENSRQTQSLIEHPLSRLVCVKEQMRHLPTLAEKLVRHGTRNQIVGYSRVTKHSFESQCFAPFSTVNQWIEFTALELNLAASIQYLEEGESLTLHAKYHANQYDDAELLALMNLYKQQLLELVERCNMAGVGGLTPSDLSWQGLQQQQLDQLVAQVSQHTSVSQLADFYPLSPLQQGVLYHSYREPHSGVYMMQIAFDIDGDLNVEIFQKAWLALIERHPIYRSAFIDINESQPLQLVLKQVSLPFEQLDWQHLNDAEQGQHFDRWMIEDRQKGFELSQAPLMRVTLITMATGTYRMIWTQHHALTDGWSIPMVLNDFMHLYHQQLSGGDDSLGQVRPYSDYIHWLEVQDKQAAENFWAQMLSGFATPTPLSIERRYHVNEQTLGEPQKRAVKLSIEHSSQLQQFAQRHQVTVNVLTQAAWALLLSHYSGDNDVVYGTVVSGRPAQLSGVENMVGPFINTVPVRVTLADDTTVAALIADLHHQQNMRADHEYIPLVQIQRQSELDGDVALFESLFVFENFPVMVASSPLVTNNEQALSFTAVKASEQTNYALSMMVVPGQMLQMEVCYDPERFDGPTIERLLVHYRTILLALTTSAQHQVRRLSWLDTAEYDQIVSKWNDTSTNYPRDSHISRLFEQQVRANPRGEALRFGKNSLSYEQLEQQSNQLARHLQTKGVKYQDRVGMCLSRSADMVVAMLAIVKLGAAYVPLDPEYPAERIVFMLEDANVVLVVTATEYQPLLPDTNELRVYIDDLRDTLASYAVDSLNISPSIDSLAYITYTSGTTGLPKGVAVYHRGVIRLVKNTDYVDLGANDVIAQASNVAFDAATFEVWGALLNGATLVGVDRDVLLNPFEFDEFIKQHQLSVLFITTALFNQLTTEVEHIFSPLRILLFGGEAVDPGTVRKVIAEGAPTHFLHVYGPTECTTYSTWHPIEEVPVGASNLPVGKPLANTQMYVCDKQLQPVAVGVPGELYIGGCGLAMGYINRPDLSAEKFIPDPFSGQVGSRLYRTGDLVRYLEDGSIEFVGRIDQQVKIRGFRIEPGEIEAAICEHPDIRESIVVVWDDHGVKYLIAYMVAQTQNVSIDLAQLKAFIKPKLPDYMIPSAFITLEQLPLTVNGKVDKRALPEPQLAQQGSYADQGPSNEKEAKLVQLWCEVLRIEHVGVHDNFFTVGGDSIIGIQLIAKAKRAGLSITPRQLFEYPTIVELAGVIEQQQQSIAYQGQVCGGSDLLPVQQWFFDQAGENVDHFNQASLVAATIPLDEGLISHTLTVLLRHHDMLRAQFELNDGQVTQQLSKLTNAQLEQSFEIITLPAYQEQSQQTPQQLLEHQIQEHANRAHAQLDIRQGRVFKLLWFKPAEGCQYVLMIAHHLVIDGISWRVLMDDFNRVYRQLEQGQGIVLAEKTSSYYQWIDRLAHHVDEGGLDAQSKYWLSVCEKHYPPLFANTHDSENLMGQMQSVAVTVNDELTEQLLKVVPKSFNTKINDILLSALVLAVTQCYDHQQLLLTMESHGREDWFDDIDLTRTVGWFTAMYPLALSLQPGSDKGQVIKSVKEQLRQVPSNGLGYGLLRYMANESILPDGVKPQISFNYLGQFGTTSKYQNDESIFTSSPLQSGQAASAQMPREHVVDIICLIQNGQLTINGNYNPQLLPEDEMLSFIGEFKQQLTELIEYCVDPLHFGITPSDVPNAQISQQRLDKILAAMGDEQNNFADLYRLSPLQQGMLYHSQLSPDSGVYIVQNAFEISGDLKVEAFKIAWQKLIERHQVLRTEFVDLQESEPLQMVVKHCQLDWHDHDWTAYGQPQQQVLFEQLLLDSRKSGFILDKAPLMKFDMIKNGDQSYRFIWSFHHALADGWSIPLLFQELEDLYFGYCNNHPPVLPRVRPFSAYIQWLNQQDKSAAQQFWGDYLRGFSTPTPLVVDGDHQVDQQSLDLPQNVTFTLSGALSQRLSTLARQQQITVNIIVQGALAMLLHRYSSQTDVVFGTTVSGRPAQLENVDTIIGPFINTVPARVKIDSGMTVADWLVDLHKQQLQRNPFEHTPLQDIQRYSEVEAGLNLFDLLLVFENYPVASVAANKHQAGSHLRFDVLKTLEQTNFALTAVVAPGEVMTLQFIYDPQRLTRVRVERMLGHFKLILESIAAAPDTLVAKVPWLVADERRQIVDDWNATATDYPQRSNIALLFAEQVSKHPQKIALSFGQQQLSYGQLNQQANRLAHYMRTKGVGFQSRVGMCLLRSCDMVVAMVAIIKLGAIYVPLDSEYPKQRLAFMLEDSEAAVVVTTSEQNRLLPSNDVPRICLDLVSDELLAQSDKDPVQPMSIDVLAYITYTSGTTGTPKGVAVYHRGAVRLVKNTDYVDLGPDDSVAQASNVAFDAATFEVWGALLNGARLVGVDREVLLTPERLDQHIKTEQINILFITTALFNQLNAAIPDIFGSLRILLFGGEAVDPGSVKNVLSIAPPKQLLHVYGPTESTTYSSWYKLTHVPEGAVNLPIGRPLANTQLYVCDSQMEPVSVGVPGELYIGGCGLAMGYINRPDLSSEKFVPDPFSGVPGARLYRTGDLVRYLDDGAIEFVGRIDQQVKIRGFRIELGEIEAVICEHPSVQAASAQMWQDGPGSKLLVAYLTGQNGQQSIDIDELKAFIKPKLPDYMMPVAFVALAHLPLTVNGKVDRQQLPAPDLRALTEDNYQAPRNEKEQILAEIWAEVLGHEKVSIYDNFYQLGGDSIISIQLIAKVRRNGLEMSAKQLFENPCIAELALVVKASEQLVAEQGLVRGEVGLLPIQQWMFDLDLVDVSHFNMATMFTSEQPMQGQLLSQVASKLLNHHDMLRAKYCQTNDGVKQILSDDPQSLVDEAVARVDLTHVADDQLASMITQAATQAQSGLSIDNAQVFKLVWLDLGDRGARILMLVHHLVCDGVSLRILAEDFVNIYTQLLSQSTPTLTDKTSAYALWSMRLNEYANSQTLVQQLPYWQQITRQVNSEIPFSNSCDLALNTVANASSCSVRLDKDDTKALLQDVHQSYNTQINDILLCALGRTLSQWTLQQRVSLTLEGHGREALFADLDLSRTIGWFTSMFPVTLELASDDDLGGAIKSVKEQLRDIPDNGIGYGVLRYLHEDDDIRQSLIMDTPAQVSFNYLGRFDNPTAQDTQAQTPLFTRSKESFGPLFSLRQQRQHWLDFSGWISEGQLLLNCSYCPQAHDEAVIESLLSQLAQQLRNIITHCQSPLTGGLTPSDVPEAQLTQTQLDTLISDHFESGKPQLLESLYPLSPLQQGMLYHSMSAPNTGQYVVQTVFDIHCDLNLVAFEQAWQLLLNRHGIFRSRFVAMDQPKPLQMVLTDVTMPFEFQDWRELTQEQQQLQFDQLLLSDRQAGFDYDSAPLMRVIIRRLQDDCYRMLWCQHHALSDGWSMPIVMNDLLSFYQAQCQGQTLSLTPLPAYRDYIAWLSKQDSEQALNYWKEYLRHFAAPTALVLDKRQVLHSSELLPEHESSAKHEADQLLSLPQTLVAQFDEQVSVQLEQFAKTQQLTLSIVAQATWALLLSRYSGDKDVLFGTVVSGRPSTLPGVESIVGAFINTVPVRIVVNSDDDIVIWLKNLHQAQLGREPFEYTPLVDIQKCSEVSHGQALFDSLLVFENYPLGTITSAHSNKPQENPLPMSVVKAVEQTNYPLAIAILPGKPMSLHLTYDPQRFTASDAGRIVEHFITLMSSFVDSAYTKVKQLPWLSDAEVAEQVEQWSSADAVAREFECAHQLVATQSLQCPDKIAVQWHQQQLSYAQLDRQSEVLAGYLQSKGVKPEQRVGVCMPRSIEQLISLLAVLKAGAMYVPMDPAYPAERLQYMCEDAQMALILTTVDLAPSLQNSNSELIYPLHNWARIESQQTRWQPVELTGDYGAYLIYTSGSTGKPKGVVVSHGALFNLISWHCGRYQVDSHSRASQLAGVGFDASVWEIWPYLCSGATLFIADDEQRDDPQQLLQWLSQMQVSHCFMPTPLAEALQRQTWPEHQLQYLLVGGDRLGRGILAEQPFVLINHYGPTENAVVATAGEVDKAAEHLPNIGRPISGTQCYILDDELNLVTVGVTGTLYIGGASLARGYHHRADLTATSFIPNPFAMEKGQRLYNSGDQVRYDQQGNIHFVGREDFQVKIRGYRIELGEIESQIAALPMVAEVVVECRQDDAGRNRLVAYIIGQQQHESMDESQLRTILSQRLPAHMVPGLFVTLETLPMTANGKVDRKALPTPDFTLLAEQQYIAPRNEVEQLLANCWEELLGVSQVGVQDNFFELGGDSIVSIQLVARAKQLGLVLTPKLLFEQPTIEALAMVVERKEISVNEQGQVCGDVPLLPISQWFFEQQFVHSEHFNQAVLLKASEPLDASMLQQTLTHLYQHHDMLRAGFQYRQLSEAQADTRNQHGQWLQQLVSVEQLPDDCGFKRIDCADVSEAEFDDFVAEQCELAQAGLTFEAGGLVKMLWFDGQQQLLLLVIHHLLVDGVSWRILLEDLTLIYQQLQVKANVKLADKTSSYLQWCEQLQQYANEQVINEQLDYWQELAENAANIAPIAYVDDESVNILANVASVSVQLDEHQTSLLLTEVHSAYNTEINDILLTALSMAMYQSSYDMNLMLTLEGHGREDLFEPIDLSRTVGWFTSMYPVCLSLFEPEDPAASIKAVKEQLRSIPDKGLGFGLLRYMADRSTKELDWLDEFTMPLVSFNYLGQFGQAKQSEQQAPLFSTASQNAGLVANLGQRRSHLLDFSGQVSRGCLTLNLSYCREIHQQEDATRILNDYQQILTMLIEHCTSGEGSGFTPSDVPDADRDQDELDRLMSMLSDLDD